MIVVVLLAISAAGQVQIPPGYEIVQLTETPYRENRPAINNHGQIVFCGRLGANEFSDEIFLREDGELIRLTDDDVRDSDPDINDDGTIVWSRGIGPDGPYGATLEIVMWQGGELTTLTDDEVDDFAPRINNLGHVVWYKWIRGGCHNANAVICFYDGSTIEQISDADWSHCTPVINDHGWIAWTRMNWCVDPWDADIMLYVGGVTTSISPAETFGPQMATINNAGQVAWQFEIGRGRKGIQLWEDGVTTLFTDWGGGPQLNDRGDLCFHRWYDDEDTYQMWLYLEVQDRLYQLSDDPFWNINGDINDAAEVAWASGHFPSAAEIRLLRRVPPAGTDGGTKVQASDVRRVDP
jgi:hypothetical protein